MPGAHAWTGADVETPSYKEQAVLSSRTFLNGHPDMKYRNEGWEAHEAGDHAAAHAHFLRAAHVGDKPSQAMLAEAYWQGRGVPADRAIAYAWADLAAERAYPVFVGLRERYWAHLDPAERERALREGRALLAEYGDAAARPRLARHIALHARRLRHSARTVTPPREVRLPGPNGLSVRIDGHQFRSPTFWDPVKYQAWQDAQWQAPPTGNVDVGEPETVPASVE